MLAEGVEEDDQGGGRAALAGEGEVYAFAEEDVGGGDFALIGGADLVEVLENAGWMLGGLVEVGYAGF